MIHELKCWQPYFQDCIDGKKKFELRINDRDFHVGDELHLNEYDYGKSSYTGRDAWFLVTYIFLGGFIGLAKGYCILSIEKNYLKVKK